jgi:alpha-galactosidase
MVVRIARMLKIVSMGVPAQPPVLKVEHLPGMTTGVSATFRAQPASSRDVVVSYRWSFGDGVTLEGPEVSHAFTMPGTYQVMVTAIGLGGFSTKDSFRLPVSGSVLTRFVPEEKRRYRPTK